VGYTAYRRGVSAFRISVIIPVGREHLEDIASGERIISKWTLEKLVMRVWIGFVWHRMQSSGRHL
jgi:hypothetical protein